jgi:DNA-binding transcriptional regulator YiaG
MTPHSTTPAENTSEELTCFDCDSPVDQIWGTHTFPYGLGPAAVELTVYLPIHVCPSCGLEFLDDEAETLKHEAICAHLGVLSPNDIRGIRRMHGMSRAAFSKVTGLGEATLNRWENGILIQSAANDRYLRLLATPNNLHRLQRLESEPSDSVPPSETDAGRFRAIDVSDEHRRQQESFRLQPRAA